MTSTMLHVRVDQKLKDRASAALAARGLTLSDAVRSLLARIEEVGGLPPELATEPEGYDAWFRAKVQEALDDPGPRIPHADAMARIDAELATRRRDRRQLV